MTGFTACVFLYPSRVSFNETFEVLEPDDGKLSRPVLRGPGPSNGIPATRSLRLRRFLRFLSTEAPLLDRHYPASSLIRASPSPHTAQSASHEVPVDRRGDHRWGFPCCCYSPLLACRRHYPGRSDGTRSLVLFHPRRPSLKCGRDGSCIARFGACSAFTHVTAYRLAKSPKRPSTPEAPTTSFPLSPL